MDVMSIADTFKEFLGNLEVKNTDDIRKRYKTITRCVNEHFRGSISETEHSLYLGSYARNTATNGFSDLDVAVILPASEKERLEEIYTHPQYALLSNVKEAIKKTYPTTDLRSDRQVVVVSFSDGMRIEVVPLISKSYSDSFCCPDTYDDGKWNDTDPKGEQRVFFDLNRIAKGNAVNLARMMRAWRSKNDVPVSGILLDTLISRFVVEHHYGFKSVYWYDGLCCGFFYYLSRIPKEVTVWSSPCHDYFIKADGEFRLLAQEAYKITCTLEYRDNYDFDDLWEWRRIFGDAFPT